MSSTVPQEPAAPFSITSTRLPSANIWIGCPQPLPTICGCLSPTTFAPSSPTAWSWKAAIGVVTSLQNFKNATAMTLCPTFLTYYLKWADWAAWWISTTVRKSLQNYKRCFLAYVMIMRQLKHNFYKSVSGTLLRNGVKIKEFNQGRKDMGAASTRWLQA